MGDFVGTGSEDAETLAWRVRSRASTRAMSWSLVQDAYSASLGSGWAWSSRLCDVVVLASLTIGVGITSGGVAIVDFECAYRLSCSKFTPWNFVNALFRYKGRDIGRRRNIVENTIMDQISSLCSCRTFGDKTIDQFMCVLWCDY